MNPQETVTIQKLVYGGDGLTRLASGEVVFVPWSAPGDLLRIEVEEPRKKRKEGHILEVTSPAPERVTPPCSVFGVCGGCQWQHLSIEEQRRWKRAIVQESLERIGKLSGITVNEPLGGSPWHYRNKVEWVISLASGSPKLGFHKHQSHDVVPFEQCWIIPQQLTTLAHWLEQQPELLKQVERVQVRVNAQSKSLLAFMGESGLVSEIEAVLPGLLQAFPELSGVVIRHEGQDSVVFGSAFLEETVNNYPFQMTSGSFFQVNPEMTQILLDVVQRLLPEKVASLLDLYSGVGLFSIGLSQQAKHIVAVESLSEAIANAQANLALNGVQHVDLKQGTVEKILKSLDETFEAAIVDPPRAGCEPHVLEWLTAHVTRQLIYVSCDPTTLARDLKQLCASGWQIESVQPLDMFPQTYHVEILVSLKR